MTKNEQANNIVVVLDRPQDAVNIGAVVRAIKNMGFAQLRLVQPRPYTIAELSRVAHHAEDVIAQIRVYTTLDAALADAVYVVGTSAIAHASRPLRRDVEAVSQELMQIAQTGLVALLFGTEDDGLNMAALDRCHCLVALPTNPHYPALNLAQSVLLFLYELNRQRQIAPPATQTAARPTVPQAMLEQLFLRSEEALTAIGFFKYDPPAVLRTLRQIAYRADLRAEEVALLLAIARQVAYTAQPRGQRQKDDAPQPPSSAA
jgi:TrmH family RNA methyltransferase